jgi:SAM-dependent methyltransferase
VVARRFEILPRLGIRPSVAEVLRAELDEAISEAEARNGDAGTDPAVAVLDAGCGRVSALRAFKPRIARFVGADIHAPAPGSLPHLDEFITADLCADASAFGPATFDVILSSFTVEHFADPAAAFRNLRTWLKPGGRLVITTVNRGHPFVAAYLGLPARPRHFLQRFVKASEADAHPLVGACNTVGRIRDDLASAGFATVEIETVGHLARAWGRRWPTFLVGLLGDAAAQPWPARRSTIVAAATAPA